MGKTEEDIPKPNLEKPNQIDGAPGKQDEREGLPSSIVAAQQKDDNAQLVNAALNSAQSSFVPDLLFSKMVNNYQFAKHIYGEKFIMHLTGYDPNYIEKNLGIPEFRNELRKNIDEKIKELKDKDWLDRHNQPTEKALEQATLTYLAEIKDFEAKGTLGKHHHKKISRYGMRSDPRNFRKGDRYKDLDLKGSIKQSIRRRHKTILRDDLKTFERDSRERSRSSTLWMLAESMKGDKILMSKKAGIALTQRATAENNKVGLIVFGSIVKDVNEPTKNAMDVSKKIVKAKASTETDVAATISKSHYLVQFKQCYSPFNTYY